MVTAQLFMILYFIYCPRLMYSERRKKGVGESERRRQWGRNGGRESMDDPQLMSFQRKSLSTFKI